MTLDALVCEGESRPKPSHAAPDDHQVALFHALELVEASWEGAVSQPVRGRYHFGCVPVRGTVRTDPAVAVPLVIECGEARLGLGSRTARDHPARESQADSEGHPVQEVTARDVLTEDARRRTSPGRHGRRSVPFCRVLQARRRRRIRTWLRGCYPAILAEPPGSSSGKNPIGLGSSAAPIPTGFRYGRMKNGSAAHASSLSRSS